MPSPFAHEILNANPYAFLDDAPLEERRARAVNLRRSLPNSFDGNIGTLDAAVIADVVEEVWPRVRDEDELFDLLQVVAWLPSKEGELWREELTRLEQQGRAVVLCVHHERLPEDAAMEGWTTPENFPHIQTLFAHVRLLSPQNDVWGLTEDEGTGSPELAAVSVVQGWMPHIGPITVQELAERLGMTFHIVHQALVHLESQGQVLRGRFRPLAAEEEWCDRSLLARIHRRTVTALRREIEPVAATDFMRFLIRWQHCAPGSQLHGEAGLREVLLQMAGYEAPASTWESSLLRTRVAQYKPEWLDNLCLRGEIVWGRLTLPVLKPNLRPVAEGDSLRPVTPNRLVPLSFVCREEMGWMVSLARPGKPSGPLGTRLCLSGVAQAVYDCLEQHGASFFADLIKQTGHLASEVEQAVWEGVAAGLVTADGFDPLRALLDPRRRRAEGRTRSQRPRFSIGRWALLASYAEDTAETRRSSLHWHEQWAKQLARRYGVVFRDVLKRESLPVTWRELLLQYRKMEWRGEIRGGRFVEGFTGEQFALPEAIEALRAVRRDHTLGAQDIRLSPADPLNLAGIILPGDRVSSHTSHPILVREGRSLVDLSIMNLV